MTNQNSDLDQFSATELRERLIASQEENKVLTDLFHTIIFDLRTPLSMIAGAAHLLLDEEQDHFPPLDEKQAEVVEIAITNANRAIEVIDHLIKKGAKAKTLEKLGASLVQDYQGQLFDANQQLDTLNLKHEATQQALQSAANEFLGAVNLIVGFSQLFLKYPESMGGPLNSDQLEGIEAIDRSAKKLHEAIEYYFFDSFGAIEAADREPAPEEVTLAEIGEMTRFTVESDLALETAVSINKIEARAVINLLDAALYRRSEGGVVNVRAETDEHLRFLMPNDTEMLSYRVKDFVDGETGRLHFTERERYLNPVGLATALVEKYGGAVYVELADDSTCILSFTLPVYREEL